MRYPLRTHPKRDIHLQVTEDIFTKIGILYSTQSNLFKSLSALVETIIFLAKTTYSEQDGAHFLFELRSIKVAQLESLGSLRKFPQARLVHLTVDHEAVEFLDMLSTQYRVVCRNRSEALGLILAYTTRYCGTPQHRAHLLARLETVLAQHPYAPSRKKTA